MPPYAQMLPTEAKRRYGQFTVGSSGNSSAAMTLDRYGTCTRMFSTQRRRRRRLQGNRGGQVIYRVQRYRNRTASMRTTSPILGVRAGVDVMVDVEPLR